MSILGKMFGKKGDKAPTPQEAIQRLRETEEMLQKKSDFLEKKIEIELSVARKNGTKNKRGFARSVSMQDGGAFWFYLEFVFIDFFLSVLSFISQQ